MGNKNLLTSSAFLHLGKATKFALLSVYETSSAFDVLSASCCSSYSPLRYRKVHWTFLHIARYAPFGSTLCLLGASALPLAPLSKATGFLHARQSARQSIQNRKK